MPDLWRASSSTAASVEKLGVWRRWPFPAAAAAAAISLSSPSPPAAGAVNLTLHSSFVIPFLPGFQLYLSFQARVASSLHSLLYG